jgi:RNA polymerase-binding transcription factor DksA
VTDIFEEATEAEMREREGLIAERQARFALDAQLAQARETARGAGPALCLGCEETIPEARRKAVPGCMRCARCARNHVNRASANR